MPKRVIDGDALWGSGKLLQVQPLEYRAEYANLIPLALANGSFEADPRLVWKNVYAYNRPDVTSVGVSGLASTDLAAFRARVGGARTRELALDRQKMSYGNFWALMASIRKNLESKIFRMETKNF